MKFSIRFHGLFLFGLFTVVLSACTMNVTTYDQPIPPVQSENTMSDSPIASATPALPASAVTTLVPTEAQPGSDPYPLPFLKPADGDTPAAGICGTSPGEIVQIELGTGPDGLPLGGRCVQVTPVQRIELANPTFESFHVTFGMFDVDVSSGSVVLLDKAVGEYLAPGVHFLPNGPVIWLKMER